MGARAGALVIATVLLVLPGACGGGGEPAPSPASALPAGTTRQAIAWGGRKRTYLLHRPYLAVGSRPPLVIVLHGATLTADQTERYYHWDPLANANGFVVAYPQGIDNAWNAGSCCGDAPDLGTDDVGFVAAVMADAAARSDADPLRRYLTGVSNGAMMTLRYQCERPKQLAAIGAVAGTLTSSCDHPAAVPFVAIHGLDDQVVSFAPDSGTVEGGPAIRLPASETISRFQAADSCHDPVTLTKGVVHIQTSTCSPGLDVEVITIDGAGHQWPGARIDQARLARDGPHDQPSPAIDATSELWTFFAGHSLAQATP
ncbi:MAG: polyhydroxybutyrate depolymerase [Actinomycetota bacterium]|nr:polyhydroxybutyrate depolymerase [Actinomycetota bacterium]